MVRRLCFFVFILMTAKGSAAQATIGGRLLLFSDESLSECALSDDGPQVADIFVVHDHSLDTRLIRFRLIASQGFTGTWLGDVLPSGITEGLGDSKTGIQLTYASCPEQPQIILRVKYQMLGTSSVCSSVRTAEYPGTSFIEMMSCHFDNWPVDADTLYVNPNETCPCATSVAVRSSTWGRVKALYR